MKIISWNLNGLTSALNNGLSSFIDEYDADIYAFQETKVGEEKIIKTKNEYFKFWAFNKENGGKFGTLCLSKKKPLNIKYDIDNASDFDVEGRVITLEFDNFFFVNCYFPNTKFSHNRIDYRVEWDNIFLKYINNLKKQKPTILCGDFNVAIQDKELSFEKSDKEFESIEEEDIKNLLNLGFMDSYKLMHPNERNKFSWWSTRHNSRKINKGLRLDYFFITYNLAREVEESTMLNNVYGSDHCPILLNIDIKEKDKLIKNKYVSDCSYNDILFFEKMGYNLNELKSADLTKAWNSINWSRAEENLSLMQKAIAIAARDNNIKEIEEAQKILVSSIDAKVLAVREVAIESNKGGVDGIVWSTSNEKMQGALSLDKKNYKAMPNRMINLECKNGKVRHIEKGTIYDTSMQCLYAYALDPVNEAWGEKKSFAYRKWRSSSDLDFYIKKILTGEDAPTWILKADVKKCYERINHEWIEKNIPLDKDVLHQFLNAGFIFGRELFDKEEGVGIGCPISPIVANMTLNGLSKYVFSKINKENKEIDYKNVDMVRYADDILFMSKTRILAEEIKKYVEEFLKERNLGLSLEKTKIINVSEGFEFVGRSYYKSGDQLFSKPSKDSILRIKSEMKDLIENFSGSQKTLIDRINKKIDGYASFHKYDEAKEIFFDIDTYINFLLFEMSKRNNPKLDDKKVFNKYWILDGKKRYRYTLKDRKDIKVKFLSDTILVDQFHPIPLSKNPYIDEGYDRKKKENNEISNVVGKYRPIWERQNGKCYYCGANILKDQERAVVEFNPEGTSFATKHAYVHKKCLDKHVDFVKVDVLPSSIEDLNLILESIDGNKRKIKEQYRTLYNFFKTCETKGNVTLSFKKIEEMIGKSLGKPALRDDFWFKTTSDSINHCWLDNGFYIKSLSFKGYPRVIFVALSSKNNNSNIYIPDWLIKNRFSEKAVYEFSMYLKYFKNKYAPIKK